MVNGLTLSGVNTLALSYNLTKDIGNAICKGGKELTEIIGEITNKFCNI